MNTTDKLLMGFLSSSATCIGKFNEDLSPVFKAPPTFYQPSFFKAINSANHCCGVNIQIPGYAANGTGLPGTLGFANQTQDNKLSGA